MRSGIGAAQTAAWDLLAKVRAEVLKALEVARNEKKINSGLEAKVLLNGSPELKAKLKNHLPQLPALFIVSQVDFFSAGAPAVVCSLLPVEDRGARNLTLRFYAALTRGSSKARALQVAQLSMIKDLKTQAYRHPRSWLPFVLVGDPR